MEVQTKPGAQAVSASSALAGLILDKVCEQVERAEHLLSLIPPDKLDWRPEMPAAAKPPARLDELLGHLLECLGGFCAVLYAFDRERLAHFEGLRSPVQSCDVNELEALGRRIRIFLHHIQEGFALLRDQDLSRPIPTVFVPHGEPLLTLLLSNLEHLTNHKHQLFLYLKMMGAPVATRDLYQWRGKPEGA